MSFISTVSSVGEDDNYLPEPTYNNLDPVWAQRHGFGPGKDCHVMGLDATLSLTSSLFLENSVDIDAFSEEFDIRMKFGRGPSSTCSTIPRPTFTAHPQPPAGGHCYPGHCSRRQCYPDLCYPSHCSRGHCSRRHYSCRHCS